MRKKIVMILCCLGFCVVAGCEKTPNETIVREKGADSVKAYESDENQGGSLMEALKIPKHYKNQESYQNGALVIDTDADVVFPDVSAVNTYAVSAKAITQELIDRMTETFLPDAKIYTASSFHTMTKDEYQKEITEYKKYKAEGNLDPYNYGKDENGQNYFDLDEQIAIAEENLKKAPENKELAEVKPQLGLEYIDEKTGEKSVDEGSFYGVAKTQNGYFDYSIDGGAQTPNIRFQIERIRDDVADKQELHDWMEGEFVLSSGEESAVSKETIQSHIDISFEEAEKLAKEKINQIDEELDIYDWDYAVYYHGEHGVTSSNILEGGYLFHFARMLDHIPLTHTISHGGAYEDMDSTLTTWEYEWCDIIVGKNGIEKVDYRNPYEVGEVQTGQVKLMDFDSIKNIYEQMMEISNADISDFEQQRTYHIQKITFGYGRIYDPTSDSSMGLLVPVWDFFGGFDTKSQEYSQVYKGESSTQSFLTINAIDGSVINRELGY